MKYFSFLALLLLSSCATDSKKHTDAENKDFTISLADDPQLVYKNLQLLPIMATEAFLARRSNEAQLKVLREAIHTEGFRITEKIPYGSDDRQGEVNLLTIHNKTNDTVYLMAGDVIQGGKQDRIFAQDMIVMPRSLDDAPVFCVERNRWQYHEIDEQEAGMPMKQAFNAYYNVASAELRKTVNRQQNQEMVWQKVGELTARNNAGTATGTYAALEQSEAFTKARDAYLDFFIDKFDQSPQVIGCVAVIGNTVLGTDIFGHPSLFMKQFQSLIHSYITDAISMSDSTVRKEDLLERYTERMQSDYYNKLSPKREAECKFYVGDRLIHFAHF